MNQDKYIINELKLPPLLIELLENDEWKAPSNKSGIKEILKLPEQLKGRFDEFNDYADFETYGLGLMTSESIAVKNWPSKKWIKDSGTMFLGAMDEEVKPGTIDIEKAILIADLGHGSDSPFTLDYRDDINNPSVMIIRWGEDPEKDNRWMKIAEDFDSFIERIGIKAPNKT
jgi:hypothetical protein